MFQAIEAAIELKLDKVEAGAQGEHKIQRGYQPVTTYSSHYILDEEFRNVIADFLMRETAQVITSNISVKLNSSYFHFLVVVYCSSVRIQTHRFGF